MEQLTLPTTVEELIELLDKKYPHKCATVRESEREIFMRTGERRVVDYLLDLKKRTEELQLANAMEN